MATLMCLYNDTVDVRVFHDCFTIDSVSIICLMLNAPEYKRSKIFCHQATCYHRIKPKNFAPDNRNLLHRAVDCLR